MRQPARHIVGLGVLACIVASFPIADARAATYTWIGGAATNNWFTSGQNLSANWNPTGTLGSVDSLVFDSSSYTAPFQNGSATITNLTFTAGAPAYTLGGNSSTLTLSGTLSNQSANVQTIAGTTDLRFVNGAVVDTGAAGIVVGLLTAAGDFSKVGGGVLTVAAKNYTGTMTLQAGTVAVSDSGQSPMFGGNVVQVAGTLTGTGSKSVDMKNGLYTVAGGTGFILAAAAIQQTGGEVVFSDGARIGNVPTYGGSTLGGRNSVGGAVGGEARFDLALVLTGSNSTTLDVAGPNVSDHYRVDGVLTYGGTLNINFTTSGSQANGTQWSLFNPYGGASGTFAAIIGTGQEPYAGLAWGLAATSANYYDQKYGGEVWLSGWTAGGQRLVFDQLTGQLIVVPEPSTAMMAVGAIVSCGLLRWRQRRRRALHAGCEASAGECTAESRPC